MQGPWSIFLIQSESEKVRSFLLLCIIYIHQIKVVFYIMACLSFPMFSNMMHLENVIMQQDCQLVKLAKCQ